MIARERELKRLSYDDVGYRIAGWCSVLYITIYSFESLIRYILYLAHASQLIVLRDGLVLGPILLIGVRGLLQKKLHTAFWIFAAFVSYGSFVSVLNFGSIGPAAVGIKILINTLFSIVAGTMLVIPGKRLGRYFLILWLVTLMGLVIEKAGLHFPWVGLKDTIGGVEVELSRDWQVSDPSSKRVGGFTRSSISAAVLISVLGIVGAFNLRRYTLRVGILAVTAAAVYLTTQKGALIGIVLIAAAICGPMNWRLPALRLIVGLAVLLDIGLPLWSNGLFMTQGSGGVFSGASFAMRITDTWPNSLKWLERRQMFPFGIGVGGIGAAQQLVGNAAQHYPDNIFLLLYTFFGVPSLLLFGLVFYAVIRSLSIDPEVATPALALLGFTLLYAIVVTVVEDQASALYLGAGFGLLLNAESLPRKHADPQSGYSLVTRTKPASF